MQPHTAFCLGIAVSGLICYALFSFFCSLFFALPSYSCLFPVLNASVSQAKFSPFSTVAFTLGIHGLNIKIFTKVKICVIMRTKNRIHGSSQVSARIARVKRERSENLRQDRCCEEELCAIDHWPEG